MLFGPYVRFHILVQFRYQKGAYRGLTANSAYDIFSWYGYLNVMFLFFFHPSVCGVGYSF